MHDITVCGKNKNAVIPRHSACRGISLFLVFKLRGIPHFVRNDRQSTFPATNEPATGQAILRPWPVFPGCDLTYRTCLPATSVRKPHAEHPAFECPLEASSVVP